MIQLIALDLDGTLVSDDKTICVRNQRALQKAREKGVYVVLCSGRSPDGMRRELSMLQLQQPGQYSVGLNGGVVFESATGRMIKRTCMRPESAQALIALGRSLSEYVNIQLYTGEHVYVERWDETTDFYRKATGSEPVLIKNLEKYQGSVVKLGFFRRGERSADLTKIRKLREIIAAQAPEDIQCAISAPYLVETFDRQIDKSKGLMVLGELLQIEAAQMMAMGDQENDLPMIHYAGIGVAMANAVDEVKKVSDYITKSDNNEGGVGEAVERFVLSKEAPTNE